MTGATVPPPAEATPTLHRVAIKPFCAFVAKTGDLDLRFTPVPTAEEGMAGHRAVVFSRSGDYRAEVRIDGVVDGLQLGGRIDGLQVDPLILDEIKTHRGPVDRIPANHTALHWAQLRTYGALYGRAHGLDSLTLRLCYYDVDAREETQFTITEPVSTLLDELTGRVTRFKQWMAQQRAHWQRRDTALHAMTFPHTEVPPGQAQLMQSVDAALAQGLSLMAQAPTGVGKTIGVLYPALKALGAGTVDRVFYLTAKTATQTEARKALRGLSTPGRPLPLRVLVLSAKERACVFPDRACHGESCPRARGFYDRLPAARAAAQQVTRLGPVELKSVAQTHQICPYFLGQEMAQWADLIIGDVNYYFDTHAVLHALTAQLDWRVAVLVDEAHNLVDRARAMYSASLSQAALRAVGRSADRNLRPALATLDRAFTAVGGRHGAEGEPQPEAPPRELRDALTPAISRIGRWFAEDPGRSDAPLLALYFDLLAMQRLMERYGAHSLCEVDHEQGQDLLAESLTRFSIHNVVPAPHLQPRLQAAHSVVCFSATLTPPDYHRRMLGLPDACRWCDVPSAFRPQQLRVRCVTAIPTEYRRRHLAAVPIARLIARVYQQTPGNYLAFFSSFAYLRQVADTFERLYPEIPCQQQSPQMPHDGREAFIGAFTAGSRQVGFAVLGGSFSEGIDLPGRRLIGAFVCNLGLTPFTDHNARMAAQVEAVFGPGTGHDYVYLYPAVQRVVQAVGRVVRSRSDEGTVYLIDRRFAEPRIRALLPPAWRQTEN
ncbi:ATP-dependent DNA helicase [Flagellatimonas centrodinii]|uniref:ATP-dependent DNA helicase n=1 Tax=Flagellatimonas centrodinii TaxID=2806210 RepID=UPI001FEFECEC|nr:ATP-dependent DNA helicase [Flagellatimonas centrodinii]ULQ46068.1 ATP-dependent DNA helicase [Flagellatimonas centrodinii]